jgi:hypothetical protein
MPKCSVAFPSAGNRNDRDKVISWQQRLAVPFYMQLRIFISAVDCSELSFRLRGGRMENAEQPTEPLCVSSTSY